MGVLAAIKDAHFNFMERIYDIPISGLEKYKVSKFGNVYSLESKIFLNPSFRDRYLYVNILKFDLKISIHVHKLICISFRENPHNKPQINHKNGVRSDNRASNLEWCTAKENIEHAYLRGLAIKRAVKILDKSTGQVFESITEAAQFKKIRADYLGACLRGAYPNKTNLVYL